MAQIAKTGFISKFLKIYPAFLVLFEVSLLELLVFCNCNDEFSYLICHYLY